MSEERVFAPGELPGRSIIEPGPRDLFWYPVTFSALAAAGNATQAVAIEADSNFYMTALSYQADIDGAALTEATNVIPLVTITITDSGSGRSLMNGAVPIPAIMGDGKRPYRFIHPRLFKRTSNFIVAVANYSDDTDYNLRLVFHGFKVYGERR